MVYFTFVPEIAIKFKKIVDDFNAKPAYFSMNKLRGMIRVHKDALPAHSKKNVVYQICCGSCNACYVGQTMRQLKTRLHEHQSHIRRNTNTHSVTEHRLRS
ncbi:hypothetical protein P5V15_013861 [Pogonomyrmex californicus]